MMRNFFADFKFQGGHYRRNILQVKRSPLQEFPIQYPLTILSLRDNIKAMIKSFKCKETEKLFHGRFSTKLPQAIQRTAVMKLKMINAASLLETLRIPPSNQLEALCGTRAGQYSIRINKQWRICFSWQGSDAHDVEIVDYH